MQWPIVVVEVGNYYFLFNKMCKYLITNKVRTFENINIKRFVKY